LKINLHLYNENKACNWAGKGWTIMKSHWVEHKGKRIMIAEYSHFGSDSAGLKLEADYSIEMLHKEPLNSVMVISNVEGTHASLGNVQVLMDVLPISNQFVRKRCVIGASGMAWGFIETFNRLTGNAPLRPFHSLEEGLDWIIQE
jgi:hypothetical protein